MKNHLWVLATLCLVFALSHPAQADETNTVKEWNFLVFINGVNNLDSFGTLNINQMEEVGSNDNMNILVQWGSLARRSVDRLLVTKDALPREVTSPVVQSLGPVDMGNWRELVDFVRWSQEKYPARHTFVVVWNHGSGWHKVLQNIGTRDISYDDRTGNRITTEELGQAMREISGILGRKVDVYASDACLMGMVEVADEMADSVDYFVGSQDLEPGQGWPYSTFLKAWNENPNFTPKDVSKLLSYEYHRAYNGGIYGYSSVTMSVFDLSKIGAYRQAVKTLGTEISLLPPERRRLALQAAEKTKSFFYSDYRDLIDFLNQNDKREMGLSSSALVRNAHAEFVISNDQNQDQNTFGLSIWLPSDFYSYQQYQQRYQGLSFHRETNWGDAVRSLVK